MTTATGSTRSSSVNRVKRKQETHRLSPVPGSERNMDLSSPDRGHQEVQNQDLDLTVLRNQIQELTDKQLHTHCSEKLRLLQRCSFYLDLRYKAAPSSERNFLYSSESVMWSLIDPQRLTRALTFIRVQLELLLSVLGLMVQRLSRRHERLCAFLEKLRRGAVTSEEAASAQQGVEQTLQDAAEFDDRIVRIQGPLDLRTKFIPNIGVLPFAPLATTLKIRQPVVIDRAATSVTSSSVHLFWSVSGDQDQNQLYEVQVRSLHPTVGQDRIIRTTEQLQLQVHDLTPDRTYQLTVQRGGAVNLVYAPWADYIIMKTLDPGPTQNQNQNQVQV